MFAKKNLVAAAALLALAGAAQAQVKLYGMVDMSVGSFENAHIKGDKTRVTAVESGKMMTSYIGLSGSEDLGGGLKAEFALESFLAGDTGSNLANLAGGFWGRGSFLALSGGFGKVAVGQYDNPLFTYGYTYNPFGSSMAFSPTMRHYYGSLGKDVTAPTDDLGALFGFDTGFVNSVTYETPTMGGFMMTVQFAPKESTTDGTKNSYALAAAYNAGPFSAALTYTKAGITDANTAYKTDQKVWALGTSYDFGVAKAFAQYSTIKIDGVATTDADGKVTGIDSFADEEKFKVWQLGVSVPVTDKASVMASYGKLKLSGEDFSDKIFSLGYNYMLSKRTDVYGVFSTNSQTGKDSGQTFAVGIRHNF